MNANQHVGAGNRILSRKQISQVHEQALQVIENIGCKVTCKEALDILGQAGCNVHDPGRVRIPRKLVLTSLEAAPKRFGIYDRNGSLAMVLKEDSCYYGTGSDCPKTIDLYTGERRQSTKADVGNLARFCDALPNIDFVMSFGIAQDAPERSDFVHSYEAMLLNSKKPAIVTGHGRNDMLAMIKMAAVTRNSFSELREKPCLVLYTEPMSPLIHTEMGISKGLVCCEYGIPLIYIGSPMMGATGPATLEGTLVQVVAECLSGLVIFQHKQPGSKFIFGGDASVMDMRTMIYSYGAPELYILNAGLADMAHYYRLPFFCIAGATDSKVLDAQAGLEYALSLYIASLNGCNIIHDCGYLESGLTSSFESVLFSDEIIGMIKSILRNLDFNEETIPIGLMNKVGPGGTFLAERHTRTHYRNTLWFPRFLDRRNFERWNQAGSTDLREVLTIRARGIFENHHPVELKEEDQNSIKSIVANYKTDVD